MHSFHFRAVYISEYLWSETITAWYVRVDDTYQALVLKRGAPFRISGPVPELADSQGCSVLKDIAH